MPRKATWSEGLAARSPSKSWAQHTPQSVGSHQGVALVQRRSTLDVQAHAVAILLQAPDTLAGVQGRPLIAHGRQQQPMQVGAVQREVGRVVADLEVQAQWHGRQLASARGVARHQSLGLATHCAGLFQQTPLPQDAGGVGPQLQAGADLTETAGLFEHPGLPARPVRGQCGRQAADATAGDEQFSTHCASNCRST